jgi:hypothetical protein
MQNGSLALVSREEGLAVWQLRWSENLHGARAQRKKVIGTIERYLDKTGARSGVAVLLAACAIRVSSFLAGRFSLMDRQHRWRPSSSRSPKTHFEA